MRHELQFGVVFLVLAGCCHAGNVKTEGRTSQHGQEASRHFLRSWNDIATRYSSDATFQRQVRRLHQRYSRVTSQRINDPRGPAVDIPSIPFTCDPALGVSSQKPTSVHALRPGDINLVGAMGDAITAGHGIGSDVILAVLAPNRGQVWSAGMDYNLEMNVTTIPNMIKKFNPAIRGASLCTTKVTNTKYAGLNVAVAGTRAMNLPAQADEMIRTMKEDSTMDFVNDWKLITVFIGRDDLCVFCDDREDTTAAKFKGYVQTALDKLHDQVPRAFVNLVPVGDTTPVKNVTFNHPDTSYPGDPPPNLVDPERNITFYPEICDSFHSAFCNCVMASDTRAEMRQLQQDYFSGLEDLVGSSRYDTRDDFTVVLQPHLKDHVPFSDPSTGLTDNRYYAPDCFHPNRRMQQVLAYMLWNVMLTKVGEKPTAAHPDDWLSYTCPTNENPYFFTNVNSEVVADGTTQQRATGNVMIAAISAIYYIMTNMRT